MVTRQVDLTTELLKAKGKKWSNWVPGLASPIDSAPEKYGISFQALAQVVAPFGTSIVPDLAAARLIARFAT